MKNLSIKIKIAAVSLLSSFILIAVFAYSDYQNQREILEIKSADMVDNIASGIKINTDSMLNYIETAVTTITENKDVQKLVLDGNRDELNAMLQPAYQKLKEKGFSNGHFHTPASVTILRLHKPEFFGDDLTSFRFLVNDTNRDKKMIRGIEEGASGLMMRVIEPVYYENNHIGSFEMGAIFGDAFVNNLKQNYGGDHFIFNFGTVSKKSDSELAKGFMASTISDDSTRGEEQNYSDKIKKNEVASFVSKNGQYQVVLTPFLNYKGEVNGYIKSLISRQVINEMATSYYQRLVMLMIIVLILAIILALLVANSIAKPLIALKKAADRVTDGDLNVVLPIAGNDEVGQLTSSMEMLITVIRNRPK